MPDMQLCEMKAKRTARAADIVEAWRRRSAVFRFLPFVFLGVLFVGHGTTAIILSLLVSIALSIAISLLLRRRSPGDQGASRPISFSGTSSGLEGSLSFGHEGITWTPRRPTMPPWFVSWREVVATRVMDRGSASDLEVHLAGGDVVLITVEGDQATIETALAQARAVRSS
jgi:hypothetical protein